MNETNSLPRIRGSIYIIFIALIDQISKILALSFLSPSAIVSIPPFFLTITTNKGFAFGTLPQFSIVYTIIGLLFVLVTVLFWKKWETYQLPMSIIAGGALGNVIDRILRGAVIDWIGIARFSIFNIADIAITIGAIWIIVLEIKRGIKTRQKTPKSPNTLVCASEKLQQDDI